MLAPRWIEAMRARGPARAPVRSRHQASRGFGRRREGRRRGDGRGSPRARGDPIWQGFPGRPGKEERRGRVVALIRARRVQLARLEQPRRRVRRRVGRALPSARRRRRVGNLVQRANPTRRDRPGERRGKPRDAPVGAQTRDPAPADDPGPADESRRAPRAREGGGGDPRARGHRHGRRVHERGSAQGGAGGGHRVPRRDRVAPRLRRHATRARLRQAPRAAETRGLVRRRRRGEAQDVLPHLSRRESRRGGARVPSGSAQASRVPTAREAHRARARDDATVRPDGARPRRRAPVRGAGGPVAAVAVPELVQIAGAVAARGGPG